MQHPLRCSEVNAPYLFTYLNSIFLFYNYYFSHFVFKNSHFIKNFH